jgi:hypothetical protein
MSLRGSISSLANSCQRFVAAVAGGSSRMTRGQCGSLRYFFTAWDLHRRSLPVSRRTQSWIIGRRPPVCKDCTFVQSNWQEFTDDQADLSSAPAHDRRDDDAQFVAEHPRDLHPCDGPLHCVPPATPDKFGVGHLREYHLHLVARLTANSISVKMGASRYFYRATLRRPDIAAKISMPRRLDHLPIVLSREEVERLLKAVGDLKLRTALVKIIQQVCVSPRC